MTPFRQTEPESWSHKFPRTVHPWLASFVASLLILVSIGRIGSEVFLPALLAALAFWLQISLGLLGILLIHDVTGGRWGEATRPFMLRSFPTLLLLVLVFCVVALGAGDIYPWAQTNGAIFLSRPFFFVRGLVYFLIWLGIAWGFAQRRERGTSTRAWSGGALLVLLFSVSFAAMDWLMTLTPSWGSSGFGVIFIAGSLAAGFALLAFKASVKPTPLLPDFGNLLLMAVMFWVYVDFMQYLIIWSGRSPRETTWYAARSLGPWPGLIVTCALFSFVLPFFALLFRKFKNSPRAMQLIAVMVLLGRLLESVIWVMPSAKQPVAHEALSGAWSGPLIGLIAIGALGVLWLWVYGRKFRVRGATS
jgi:hypothetical protein